MRRVIGRRALAPYLSGLGFVAVATVGLILLQNQWPTWFNLPIVIIAYLLAINLSTQTSGFGPGVVAAVAAFLCLNFFFIDPRGTLLVENITDLIVLALFLVVALVNSQLLGRAQRRAIEAAQRERDATRFYEFSLALISSPSTQEIAKILAARLRDVLDAQAAEVRLQLPMRELPAVFAAAGRAPIGVSAKHTEPVVSARATFGDIRVWRSEPLSLGEERMTRTFAGEAALILERMRMADIETRTKVLEQSDQLKTALLGSVSHELRTPLATLRAGSESLRSGLVPAESDAGREMLDDMGEAANHLTKLVNNMLDMSKIDSGALKPVREWCDLDEVVRGVAARMRNDLGQHALQIAIPDETPLVPVDPVQMDQVFSNLISNSVKYAPAGTDVHIATELHDGQTILVSVSNESPRLPPEDLERIFDKFYRVTNADRVVGTGLGLSICKGIVEAHGGRIWAVNSSEAGPGLMFNITLPLTWDGASPNMPPPEATESDEVSVMSANASTLIHTQHLILNNDVSILSLLSLSKDASRNAPRMSSKPWEGLLRPTSVAFRHASTSPRSRSTFRETEWGSRDSACQLSYSWWRLLA